jgi:XTP/dITP diphosphohydrolase
MAAKVRHLLYATTNPGKVLEVRKYLQSFGVALLSPAEIGLALDVEETGQSLEENAALKAKAYFAQVPHTVVLADDTGVEIDALHGEPGIHVRRWRDGRTPMSDQAIIDYCMARLQGIPQAQRGAQFRTVIALCSPDGAVELFDGILRGEITDTPAPLNIPGFPFEAMFYIQEWGKLLGDIHTFSMEEKLRRGYLTHREQAVQKAVSRLRALLNIPG